VEVVADHWVSRLSRPCHVQMRPCVIATQGPTTCLTLFPSLQHHPSIEEVTPQHFSNTQIAPRSLHKAPIIHLKFFWPLAPPAKHQNNSKQTSARCRTLPSPQRRRLPSKPISSWSVRTFLLSYIIVLALTAAAVKNRKEKLLAMCDAQVASLRSRLERRVNRIPASKRSMKLVDLLDGALPAAKPVAAKAVRAAAAKKQAAPPPVAAPAPAPAPVSAPAPVPTRPTAPAAATRKTRAAPAPPAKKEAPKPISKPAPKTARGKKRPSDDGDKENEELNMPKKRAKTVAPTKPAATRSTRAASRKAVPSQVLSPKPDNGRPTVARTRRQR